MPHENNKSGTLLVRCMRPSDPAPVPDTTQQRTSLLAARRGGVTPGALWAASRRPGARRRRLRPHLPVAGLLVARKRSPVQRAGEPCEPPQRSCFCQAPLPEALWRPLTAQGRRKLAVALLERAQAPASPRLATLSAASLCTHAPSALQACPRPRPATPKRLDVPAGALRGHCPSVPLSLRGQSAAAAGPGPAFPLCDPACCVCVQAGGSRWARAAHMQRAEDGAFHRAGEHTHGVTHTRSAYQQQSVSNYQTLVRWLGSCRA